ncbi:pyrroloquinoline-quinone synthase PqqC [Streptomyces rubellomurinus]|uniref:Pyrroloquinoline-quinone synthase n=1 Tax=Streptomyces rubellomurinus (strain ATCC 31215) TaxID=359131 RepID=A0A0F2TEY7_STRR3|nr:pyrroloquinoline-quinone synthase PqqC [Streptomyces rubellomurinus]KJS61699.1 pyrroloquinoline quinone biosynthesis protein PqqC [Streptomyces rubellomurinus]
MARPLSRERFAARLYDLRGRYWDTHPFHLRLHSGGCTPPELRRWVANRWYYQLCLTRKNAAIIANCPLPEVRRAWAGRLAYQDGPRPDGHGPDGPRPDVPVGAEGGLADWLVLAEAVGLDRAEVLDERHVARGVRFAVDGYLHFCQTRPWTEGVAAALTEMFSPDHMAERVTAWRAHYGWIAPAGYAYFEHRIPVAREDSARTLELVLDHCVTEAQQQAAVAALAFKCEVLRAMLDAVDYGPDR